MSELDPAIRRRAMPGSVKAARATFARARAGNEELLRSAVEVHLRAYSAALDELQKAHRLVSDATDLDLTGKTRASTLWLVARRCIAQARATVYLLAGGFANEVPPLLRQLHESNRLLDALAADNEDDLVLKWLANKDVRPKEAAAATDRHQQRLREDMNRSGVRAPEPTKKVFHNDLRRRQQRIEQASVRRALWISGWRS
jgi:hypothetical protein